MLLVSSIETLQQYFIIYDSLSTIQIITELVHI